MKEIELGHGYKLVRRDRRNWELYRFCEPKRLRRLAEVES